MNAKDARLLEDICRFVRVAPERFRDAGILIDENYSPENCAERDRESYLETYDGDLPMADDWQSPYRRLREQIIPDLRCADQDSRGLPPRALAERVLLVTFLLADSECDTLTPRLTEFQDWSCCGLDHLATHDLSAENAVADWAVWMDLCRRTWAAIDGGRLDAPANGDAVLESTHRAKTPRVGPDRADQFRTVAKRFRKYETRNTGPRHLAANICDTATQAGRLLVEAIDARDFPEWRSDVNHGWWDRKIGRLPGGPFTVYARVSKLQLAAAEKLSDVPLEQMPYHPKGRDQFNQHATKPFTSAQFESCWCFAVGSWLVRNFPARFRDHAASWDWDRIATDKQGRLVDKEGQPIQGQWFRDGEPLPDDFRLKGDLPTGKYAWKLDKELAYRTDLNTDADWLEHYRIRAEVYSVACELIADRIDAKRDDDRQRDAMLASYAEEEADALAVQWREHPVTLRLAVWALAAAQADRRGVTRYEAAQRLLHWMTSRIQERTGVSLDSTFLTYVAVLQHGDRAERPDLEEKHREVVAKLFEYDGNGLCDALVDELHHRVPALAAIVAPETSAEGPAGVWTVEKLAAYLDRWDPDPERATDLHGPPTAYNLLGMPARTARTVAMELRSENPAFPPLPEFNTNPKAELLNLRDWCNSAKARHRTLPVTTEEENEGASRPPAVDTTTQKQALGEPQLALDEIPDTTALSHRDLAKIFGIRGKGKVEALRKRLDRFRSKNLEGWIEVSDCKPRDPRFLYEFGTVRPIVEDYVASVESSGQRPAKD